MSGNLIGLSVHLNLLCADVVIVVHNSANCTYNKYISIFHK